MGLKMFLASFGQFLATFWQLFGQFWRGVANLLSILAAAKQVVYSKEYTVSGIPRALLVGLLIEVLGLHLMDPGMDQRAAVFRYGPYVFCLMWTYFLYGPYVFCLMWTYFV